MTLLPVWWEKTVEYAFILAAERQKGLHFAAPLAGVQERAGDAIFSIDSRLVLVEFKRAHDDLESEHKKYEDYKAAEAALSKDDAHHHLIYGSAQQVPNQKPELLLHARTYFSGKPSQPALTVLDVGVGAGEFNEYLRRLLSFKHSDGRSTGTVGPESMASVFGVSSKGSSCSSISISEYVRIALPHLNQSHSPPNVPSPSRPRAG